MGPWGHAVVKCWTVLAWMEWAASESVVSLQWHHSGASQVVLVVKNPSANAGDKRLSFDPWVGKIPWRKHDNPLHYSCLDNPMDRGNW